MTPKKEETTINDEKDDDITEVIKNTNENVPRPVILGLPEESWVVAKRKKNKNKCKNIVAD